MEHAAIPIFSSNTEPIFSLHGLNNQKGSAFKNILHLYLLGKDNNF